MAHNGPINVEHTLLKSRSFRRRPGDIPYPVQHVGASCCVFDVWNNMFRTQSQSLTLHKFETPPAVVLDLGCGSGYWVIEAAKKWKESTIVGFDFKNIQPKLHHAQALRQHKDIAHRVKWVHGNLLDGLPFHSNQFDFVRVVNIGLGVPEDEGPITPSGSMSLRHASQDLLEIARVMKPGGVIEVRVHKKDKFNNFINADLMTFIQVIEEDPIFPCARPSQREMKSKSSSSSLVNRAPSLVIPSSGFLSSISSATIWSDPLSIKLDERYDISSPNSSTSLHSLMSSPTTPVSGHPFTPATPGSAHPFSATPPSSTQTVSPPNSVFSSPPSHPYLPYTPRPSISQAEIDRVPDLRDHSRLKAAWNAMLASRFIAENLLSVLPFYLSSSFVDVQSHPPIKVLLPCNSRADRSTPQRSSSDSNSSLTFTSPPSLSRTSSTSTWSTTSAASSNFLATSGLSRTSSAGSLDTYTSEYAQMHLANTVHVVSGCKEAIWQEYKRLYDVNVVKVVSPKAGTLAGHVAHSGPGNVKSSIRESFDDEWASWYNDMTDRIGMRGLMTQLNWAEPPGQRPDWHVWRAKVQVTDDMDPSSHPNAPPNLCRSIRGFVGLKPVVF
ncbi:hypothetical protein H0H87_012468 [Tephrocybe sp. NHM501043]|nr:hypothetical protein H0H87_012468 [Tephrocybe sp. NHM501043]